RACRGPTALRALDRPHRRGDGKPRGVAGPRGTRVPPLRRPRNSRGRRCRRRRAWRRCAAVARVRELRPVPRLRRARGNLPHARRGAVVKKGQLESHLLVLVTLALVAFGLVMVYSSTSAPAALARTDPMSYLKKQGVYALIGVPVMISASRFDYRRLRLPAPSLVLTALGGCLPVLVIGSRT